MRFKGIGSSDIPDIFGHGFRSPLDLWYEKTGQTYERVENEAMALGTRFEPTVLDWFCEQVACLQVNRSVSLIGDEPWMLANLDAAARLPEGREAVVEAKTVGLKGPSDKLDEFGEEGTDQVPLGYLLQVHWQMIVSHVRYWYMPVLMNEGQAGGLSFRLYQGVRDEELSAMVLDGARAFWQCVLNRTPPAGGGVLSSDVAKRIRRQPNTEPVQIAAELIERYQAAVAAAKQAEEAKELAHVAVVAALDANEWGIGGGFKVTYKTTDVERFDGKAFASVHPELFKQFTKKSSYRTLRVSAAKK